MKTYYMHLQKITHGCERKSQDRKTTLVLCIDVSVYRIPQIPSRAVAFDKL